MNGHPAGSEMERVWGDAELEAFLDGALDESAAAGVGEALRENPALRERLAAVRRADEVMTEALLIPAASGEERERGGVILVRRSALAAAACGAVAGAVWMVALRGEEPARGPEVVVDTGSGAVISPDEPARSAAPYEAVPVVLSVKIPARGRGVDMGGAVGNVSSGSSESERGAAPEDGALRRALAMGDTARAAALLSGAGPLEREAAYREMGELLRSAAIAERVLDAMEPAEQLAACRLWADDPRLRTVVFPRLRTLAAGGELSGPLALVVEEMSRRDDLRPWLRSYGLAARGEKAGEGQRG